MRFRRIARNYVTHWFMADLSMILLDVARLHWNPELADAAAMLEGSRQLLAAHSSSCQRVFKLSPRPKYKIFPDAGLDFYSVLLSSTRNPLKLSH